MRSEKIQAHGGGESNDPRLYPTQIFMASLRDGVGSDSLDLAVEQIAHLARATDGLIEVDRQCLGRVVKALGSHPARFRVIELGFFSTGGWLSAFTSMAPALGAGTTWWGRRRRRSPKEPINPYTVPLNGRNYRR
jgi:hypothetical protein